MDMTIQIAGFPIKDGGFVHSSVNLYQRVDYPDVLLQRVSSVKMMFECLRPKKIRSVSFLTDLYKQKMMANRYPHPGKSLGTSQPLLKSYSLNQICLDDDLSYFKWCPLLGCNLFSENIGSP